jgi:hypothetical protein
MVYGAIVTEFRDDGSGKPAAVAVSLEDIRAVGEYRAAMGFYIRARNLYEEVLALDYKLTNNPDQALIIATEYEEILETVAKLGVDTDAANLSTSYNQFKKQLGNFVKTDIAVYIQNVSQAISENNPDKGDNAIINRSFPRGSVMPMKSPTTRVLAMLRYAQNAEPSILPSTRE